MSRMAFKISLPGVLEPLTNEVSITTPVGIVRSGEQVGDISPQLPASRIGWNQSGRQPTSDSYVDFLAFLHTTNEVGCVLTKFAESYGGH